MGQWAISELGDVGRGAGSVSVVESGLSAGGEWLVWRERMSPGKTAQTDAGVEEECEPYDAAAVNLYTGWLKGQRGAGGVVLDLDQDGQPEP